MRALRATPSRYAALVLAVFGATVSSCSDPVPDAQIAALGDEDPGVPVGPEHRPGQPCVLCHTARGPASNSPFAIGGTVYETNAAGSPGAENVRVVFVDSVGAERVATTNAAGNFYITQAAWSDLAYPFKVAIKRGADEQRMTTTVNREGSCNYCHLPGNGTRDSIAQVYLKLGGT